MTTVADYLKKHPDMGWVRGALSEIGPLKPCPFCGSEARRELSQAASLIPVAGSLPHRIQVLLEEVGQMCEENKE